MKLRNHHGRGVGARIERPSRRQWSALGCLIEPMEERVLLAAELTLSGPQTITPYPAINLSNDAPDQTEMSVDINPYNPLNVAGISHRFDSTIGIEVYYSANGGDTYARNVIDTADDGLGTGARFDPAIHFDGSGQLFIAYGFTTALGDPNATTRLVVGRSLDGGATFGQFRTIENRQNVNTGSDVLPGVDKWQLTAAGWGGVYVAYTQNAIESGVADQRIVVSGSDDSGNTFTTPVVVNDSSVSGASQGNLFAHPGVGAHGELYVSWTDHNGNAVRFDRDLDGLWGTTYGFGTDVTVRALQNGALTGDYVPAQPDRGIFTGSVMAVDSWYAGGGVTPTGNIYIVFVERASAGSTNTVIRLARSTNQGATWTTQTVESATGTNFLPWVAVDRASGMPAVVYYTTAGNAPGDNASVRPRLAVSYDAGVSWSRANLTNVTSNETGGNPNDYLEYIGLAFTDGTAQAFWSARRPGSVDDLDAYTARAYVQSTSGSNDLAVWNDLIGPVATTDILVQRNATNSEYADVYIDGTLRYRGLYASIESIHATGRAASSIVIGSTLYVPTTLTGDSSNDTITGGGGDDSINGLGGNDQLSGRNGNDLLIGDIGNDTLYGGNGNDTLYGNDGNDTIFCDGDPGFVDYYKLGSGSDILHSDVGVDQPIV